MNSSTGRVVAVGQKFNPNFRTSFSAVFSLYLEKCITHLLNCVVPLIGQCCPCHVGTWKPLFFAIIFLVSFSFNRASFITCIFFWFCELVLARFLEICFNVSKDGICVVPSNQSGSPTNSSVMTPVIKQAFTETRLVVWEVTTLTFVKDAIKILDWTNKYLLMRLYGGIMNWTEK